MASVNKVILVGNLGRDPELKTFPSGGQICNVSIATTEKWKDKNTGERKELTEWHNVLFNERLAQIASQYLRKGSSVYVEGRLRTRKWQDKNGQDRYSTEIRADVLHMLNGQSDSGGQNNNQATQQQQRSAPAPQRQQQSRQQDSSFDDDSIPF